MQFDYILSVVCRAKKARKSWDLLHRSCWVGPRISTLRTSPRMEVPLVQSNNRCLLAKLTKMSGLYLFAKTAHALLTTSFHRYVWSIVSDKWQWTGPKVFCLHPVWIEPIYYSILEFLAINISIKFPLLLLETLQHSRYICGGFQLPTGKFCLGILRIGFQHYIPYSREQKHVSVCDN